MIKEIKFGRLYLNTRDNVIVFVDCIEELFGIPFIAFCQLNDPNVKGTISYSYALEVWRAINDDDVSNEAR